MKELEELKNQAFKYELIKVSIQSYLKSYTETLAEYQEDLKAYEALNYKEVIELKKEHIALITGKIEILTALNKK